MDTVGTMVDVSVTVDTTGGRPALTRDLNHLIIVNKFHYLQFGSGLLGVGEGEAGLNGHVLGLGNLAAAVQGATDSDRLITQTLDYRVELDYDSRP